MEAVLIKNGNSIALIIPQKILKELGWVRGTRVELQRVGENIIVTAPEMERLIQNQIDELRAMILEMQKKNLP